MIFAGFLYAYGGLTLLGLAMNRHYLQVWRRAPATSTSRLLRSSGWILLVVSLLASVANISWSIGFVSWIGALSAAAGVLIFLLPYQPKVAAGLALVTPTWATVLILIGSQA